MAPKRALVSKAVSGRVQKRPHARTSLAKSISKRHAKSNKSRYIESEADDIMQDVDIDPDHDELQKMMNRLITMVGRVKTLEQVAADSQWMTSMQCTENDMRKFKTFNAHAENVGLSAIWPEITCTGPLVKYPPIFYRVRPSAMVVQAISMLSTNWRSLSSAAFVWLPKEGSVGWRNLLSSRMAKDIMPPMLGDSRTSL